MAEAQMFSSIMAASHNVERKWNEKPKIKKI